MSGFWFSRVTCLPELPAQASAAKACAYKPCQAPQAPPSQASQEPQDLRPAEGGVDEGRELVALTVLSMHETVSRFLTTASKNSSLQGDKLKSLTVLQELHAKDKVKPGMLMRSEPAMAGAEVEAAESAASDMDSDSMDTESKASQKVQGLAG